MTKYVFVTGGVVSGLGKGITAASLGRLLKARGFKVAAQKLDPYINVDPGTMSPYQHGEVYVTEDGAETDLDLGHYERFIDEDLNKYSADKIVEMYGTHVLTNITVGGKYTAYYKSVIIEENSSTEKTEIVSAGAKYNLSNIGLDAHGSWSKTEVEERNKKNSNWECYIKALGGSTSGTTITLAPEQGPSFSINLGAWTESVDDQHSRLFDVNWNATYPIYDLISDPIKKQEMKEAVFRYIDSKKIDVIELLPLYQYYSDKYINHSYTTHWRGEVDLTDRYEGVIGYICAKQLPGTTPLYEYYSEKYVNHSYCTNWRGTISGTDRYQGTLGYIYTSQVPGTTPLYGYYSKKYTNHSLSTHWRGTQEGSDAYQCTWGYVY